MFKSFLSYYKPHLRLLTKVLSMVALFAFIELSIPIFSRYILNTLIPNNDIKGVITIAIIMISLLIAYAILHYFVGYYGHMLGISMEKDMRIKAFEKLQKLGFDYFDTHKTGTILARLTSDLHEVAELAHHGIEEVVAVTIIMVFGYIYLIQMNFLVTTLLFLIVIVMLFLLVFTRTDLLKAFRNLRKEHGEINAKLESSIYGIRLTRAFANEAYEIQRFKDDNDIYIGAYQTAYKSLGRSNAMNQFFVQFLNVLVLVCGAFLVLNGNFSPGDMFAYFIYFGMLIGPVKRLMTMLETFQQGWAGFERYLELMNLDVVIKDDPNAKDLEYVEGNIQFDNVQFSYGNENESILSNFNLNIEAGKMIALVGPSGVGKTTIAQLIPRFYEINSGSIRIDNTDIKKISLNSLRRSIGYVQQDVIIFWGTIADNIRYGKPNASMEEVIEAAKKAEIHDFISQLEHGYDTLVGERGVTLSGGQKQRLSIARIFLKDPRILILDEATSALDNITEHYVQNSFDKLAENRTVVVVAHRLSTVQNADLIIVLGKDGISQTGTHHELINKEGHYRDLYNASNGNFLPTSSSIE